MKKVFCLVSLLFCISVTLAQYGWVKPGNTWTPIPKSMSLGVGWTDWANAGRDGGTPTLYGLFVDFNAYQGSVTQKLVAATAAAATLSAANCNQIVVVKIPAGQFIVTSTITVPSNVVIKGAGSDQTFLTFQTGNKGNDCFSFSGYPNTSYSTVTSGQTMGSTSITLDNASSFNNLDYIDLCDSRSIQGNGAEEPYSIGQVVQIVSKSGNTLTLKDKLSIDHSGFDTRVTKIIPVSNSGLEDLSLYRANEGSGGGFNVNISYAVNCWIRGCELNNASSRGIYIAFSTQITVKGNWIHHSQAIDGTNGNGYGVSLYNRSTNCLIEDNILNHLRHSIVMSNSANRNVIAYNYSYDRLWQQGTYFLEYCGDIQLHGEFSHRNLFEGNAVNNIVADDWYGGLNGYSASKLTGNGPYNVFLRNSVDNSYSDVPSGPLMQISACDNAFIIGTTAIPIIESGMMYDWSKSPPYVKTVPYRGSNYVNEFYAERLFTDCSVAYLPFILALSPVGGGYDHLSEASYYMTETKMQKLWTDSYFPPQTNPCNGPYYGYVDNCSLFKTNPQYVPAYLRRNWTKNTLSGGTFGGNNITVSPAYPEGNGTLTFQVKLDGILQTATSFQLETSSVHTIEVLIPSGWTGYWNDGERNNPRTITVTQNMTYLFNYKKLHFSSNPAAFRNSSQRKYVQDESNEMGCAYESAGKIWSEYSFDQGGVWAFFNGGLPINDGIAKSPSITSLSISSNNYIFIVYQEQSGNNYKIKIKGFVQSGRDGWMDLYLNQVISTESSENYSTNANPVIAVGKDGIVLVVWERKNTLNSKGLVCQHGYFNTTLNQITWYNPEIFTGSNVNSTSPTCAGTYIPNANIELFHVAWLQTNLANGGNAIYYVNGTYDTYNHCTEYSTVQNLSNNDGYTSHYSPSIIGCDDNTARVCWIGERQNNPPPDLVLNKTQASLPTKTIRVVFAGTDNTYRWNFGSNAASPSIARSLSGTLQPGYAFVWSENDGYFTNKFADNTLSTIRTLNSHGLDVQFCNGPVGADIRAMSFSSNSIPYSFDRSNNLGAYYSLQKVNSNSIHTGREGNVNLRGGQFYFGFADVSTANDQIKFISTDEKLQITSSGDLNSLLQTEIFTLTDNSTFNYSVQYGYVDSTNGLNAFAEGEYLNFRVELVDASTSEILGTYDNARFDNTHIFQFKDIAYEVNCSGIGNRSVILRLKITSNSNEPLYALTQIYSDNLILQKSFRKKIEYQGTLAVTNYSLSQNYPNPFNPITIINYQIPKSGHVILRIYDILGKEVTCLIDEEKQVGSYQTSFNASHFSSGVYFYKLECNDFKSVKKMILLK
jgi:hypothetical protein